MVGEHRAAFVRALQRHVGRKPARSVGHVVALEDANERQICRRQENVQDKERPSLRAVRILCEYDQRGVLSNRVRDNPVLVVSEENVQENNQDDGTERLNESGGRAKRALS